MLDLSEFVKETKIRQKGCSVSRLELTEEQNTKFTAAMEEPAITGEAISRVLKSWGFSVSGDTLQRHRRGVCSCD